MKDIYRGFVIDWETESDYFGVASKSNDTFILIDFPLDIYDGLISESAAKDNVWEKMKLIIDAWYKDHDIKNRIPRELIEGYNFQCSLENLKDTLDRLVVVPGQLRLL